MRAHTDLGLLFDAIGDHMVQCDWLFTDWECTPPDVLSVPDRTPVIIARSAFADVAGRVQQCIWGVLSAVQGWPSSDVEWGDGGIGVVRDETQLLPSIEENAGVWEQDYAPQLAGAIVEILAIDSSYTMVTSDIMAVHDDLRRYFPEARDFRGRTLEPE